MKHDKPHILVVDDDERLRALLRRYLSDHGFLVTVAASAAEARQSLTLLTPDLMVLDRMMPGETGLELAQALRQTKAALPILMLTAMGETHNRIEGLQTGADDYLTKPFEPMELVLRIENILRRAGEKPKPAAVSFGPFVFHPATDTLLTGDAPVHLTTGEMQLLKALALRAGAPVSREELAGLVSAGDAASGRSIDVQINRLRKKIEPAPSKPLYIRTVRGAGYVLQTGGAHERPPVD